eukprot:140787-Rhodomonas_salina.2
MPLGAHTAAGNVHWMRFRNASASASIDLLSSLPERAERSDRNRIFKNATRKKVSRRQHSTLHMSLMTRHQNSFRPSCGSSLRSSTLVGKVYENRGIGNLRAEPMPVT